MQWLHNGDKSYVKHSYYYKPTIIREYSMSMKYPKMEVTEYLKLLKDAKVSASKAFALSNQDVRKGTVHFRSKEKVDLLYKLLVSSESGIAPAEEFYLQKKRTQELEKALGSIDIESLKTTIKNLAGPDGQGWYRGQCPNCAIKEAGEIGHTTNSFVFNDNDGRLLCHKGCHISDIATALRGD